MEDMVIAVAGAIATTGLAISSVVRFLRRKEARETLEDDEPAQSPRVTTPVPTPLPPNVTTIPTYEQSQVNKLRAEVRDMAKQMTTLTAAMDKQEDKLSQMDTRLQIQEATLAAMTDVLERIYTQITQVAVNTAGLKSQG